LIGLIRKTNPAKQLDHAFAITRFGSRVPSFLEARTLGGGGGEGSLDKSTLTVRKVGSRDERTVHYDGATRWVSQEHGSKKVNDIDASQVEEGDRVIARGIWDKGMLYATLISKRLSHSK